MPSVQLVTTDPNSNTASYIGGDPQSLTSGAATFGATGPGIVIGADAAVFGISG